MSALGKHLRRLGWRLAQRLGASPLAELVYSGHYVLESAAIGPESQIDPRRAENVLAFLASEGLVRRGLLRWPRPASFEQLCRVHTVDYLESLREPGSLTRILGLQIAVADEDRFLDLQRAMVGGTLLATRAALETGRTAVNLGGGLHHAHADRGGGFCVFNDVAVAIATFREHGFAGRIAVVDLDLHDGDGTRAIFAGDESVHTFSIHNRPWDETEAIEDTSVALGDDVGDGAYLEALRERLPPVLERFRPALAFYLAGCDPAASDVLGNWRISGQGMLDRDRFVVEELRRLGDPPTVVALAGGYGREAWRYTARFLGWLLAAGRELEVPSTDEITLRRYRVLSQLLSPAELTGDDRGDDLFGLTEDEVLGALVGQPRESRFLGYYSRHGLELALERLGLLQRLRDRGFEHPTLELELDNPAGQTLRLFSEPDPSGPRGRSSRAELLAELRARRDRRALPGFEMLRIEWLLLQNPRARFRAGARPLPGQAHPGLGLLRDVAAVIVLMCERLGLDGVLFVPAHYHMAARAEEFLRFLEPEDAARFDALREALAGRPLAEATRAVEDGRVVDAATGEPLRWHPVPMLMAVSGRLKERLGSDEYRERLEAARGRFRFRLDAGPPHSSS
ncbi:MAG TPA: histone deacetylase [Thermoanaerobaculia bacterium]|nr:histone deacetylase [Thermoanaerobaculia bacterium]